MSRKKEDKLPPRWSTAFISWFCPDDLLEGILGDLQEQFKENLPKLGYRKSAWIFSWQVIRLFHPSIILRNHFKLQAMNMGLVQNSLKVAFRSMRKYAFYSSINIFGLSLAIAFIFLAFRFIRTELAFDQFHTKGDHVFRLYQRVLNMQTGALSSESAITSIPLSKDLHEELPAITEFTRIGSGNTTIKVNNEYYEEKITYVDPGFFHLFDFPLLDGQPFSEGQTDAILLSEEQAQKLFGKENPIGKIISLKLNDQEKDFKISGVIDPSPSHSSIQFEFLVHLENLRSIVGEDSYTSYHFGMVENYILIDDGQDISQLEKAMTISQKNKSTDDQFETRLGLQPLKEIHFEHSLTGNALYISPQKLYIVGGLALLVLVIALINFVILSTSQSLHRAKEMGLRSTLGAQKRELKRQMITESCCLVAITSTIGVLLAALASPYFSNLISADISWSMGWKEVGLIAILCLLMGFINGHLQALFLIKDNASQSLRRQLAGSTKISTLNSGLMVLQFIFSIILFIAAIGMRSQMHFIQQKDLGYEKERLLEININGINSLEEAKHLVDRFRSESLKEPSILTVSACMNNVREPWTQLGFEQIDGQAEKIFYNQVDPSYISAMKMTILQGEDFKADASNAKNAILVNETLVKHFGWEHPLQEQIPGKQFTSEHQIIGVVKDFHFSTMHQKIEPLILALDLEAISSGITGLSTFVWPANLYQILVRTDAGNLPEIVRKIEALWKDVAPDKAFVYHFFDDSIEAQYQDDLRWAKLMDMATLFAIVIAWMGLLGLMRLTLQKRTKEIGIRRILGASLHGLISLLARQYVILIVIGNLIAIPISFLLLKRWLNHFSYRIELHPSLFILAGLAVVLFSFISLGIQSLSTVRSAVDKGLKDE